MPYSNSPYGDMPDISVNSILDLYMRGLNGAQDAISNITIIGTLSGKIGREGVDTETASQYAVIMPEAAAGFPNGIGILDRLQDPNIKKDLQTKLNRNGFTNLSTVLNHRTISQRDFIEALNRDGENLSRVYEHDRRLPRIKHALENSSSIPAFAKDPRILQNLAYAELGLNDRMMGGLFYGANQNQELKEVFASCASGETPEDLKSGIKNKASVSNIGQPPVSQVFSPGKIA